MVNNPSSYGVPICVMVYQVSIFAPLGTSAVSEDLPALSEPLSILSEYGLS